MLQGIKTAVTGWVQRIGQLFRGERTPWQVARGLVTRQHGSVYTLQGLEMACEYLTRNSRPRALTALPMSIRRELVVISCFANIDLHIQSLVAVVRHIQGRDDMPPELPTVAPNIPVTLDGYLTDIHDHRVQLATVVEYLTRWSTALREEMQKFEANEPERFAYLDRKLHHLYSATFNVMEALIVASER